MDNNLYFAQQDVNTRSRILLDRANKWYQTLESSGYKEKLKTMWCAYHGTYFDSNAESHAINFAGEQGELVQVAVNHLRNIAQHMLNMITGTPGARSFILLMDSIPVMPGGMLWSLMTTSHLPDSNCKSRLSESDTSVILANGKPTVTYGISAVRF